MTNAFPYRPVQLTEDIYAAIHYGNDGAQPWLYLSTGCCVTITTICKEETVSALRALADHLEEAFRMMAKRAAIEAAMADPTPETGNMASAVMAELKKKEPL
jgi:hypothetical protein